MNQLNLHAPVTQIARVPQMIGGHPSLPPRNVKELVAFMKARPGAVDYSAGNYGGHPHVTMVLFMTRTPSFQRCVVVAAPRDTWRTRSRARR